MPGGKPQLNRVTIRITNPTDKETTFVLEPWGEVDAMSPGDTFEVVAEGPPGDTLQVENEDGRTIVYG